MFDIVKAIAAVGGGIICVGIVATALMLAISRLGCAGIFEKVCGFLLGIIAGLCLWAAASVGFDWSYSLTGGPWLGCALVALVFFSFYYLFTSI